MTQRSRTTSRTSRRSAGGRGEAGGARPPVRLRVLWGDLAQVEADVHVVGHYQGVMPTSAEKALDKAISGPAAARQIIAEHTRREWFLGDFGHVNYFPPADAGPVKVAAVAGMGRPGTFTESRGAQLAENLLLELCALRGAGHVAVVAIGSGAGNLSLAQTARSMVQGFRAALRSERMQHPCTQIDVVEIDRLRAERLLNGFIAAAGGDAGLAVDGELAVGAGGRIGLASAAVYALSALVTASREGGTAVEKIVRSLPEGVPPELIVGALGQAEPDTLLRGAELALHTTDAFEQPPVRISVLDGGEGTLRVAAITGTATVPERQIDADPKLIDEMVRRMTPPDGTKLKELSQLMSRMVVPGDLRSLATPLFPIIFEVDRRTARIHWELVADLVYESSSATGDEGYLPLVLQNSVSRQLRTTYSRPPARNARRSREINVLLIGDPGGPDAALPGARREVLAVHEELKRFDAHDVRVTTLIGARGTTEEKGFPPAARLDVLQELLTGDYEVVHYCGHGTFDPVDQRRAGWYFADGLLTARELNQLEGTPPRLIVANACFSSRLGAAADSEALLMPSLADEFFRGGVGNYVGAAWKVDDDDAVVFSRTLYEKLLSPGAATLGEAITAARRAVWDSYQGPAQAMRGVTWLAYQHYGDPSDRIRTREDAPET